MANLLLESFTWGLSTATELLSCGKGYSAQDCTLNSSTPRTTGYQHIILGNDKYLRLSVTNLATVYVGMAYRVANTVPFSQDTGILSVRDGTSHQITIGIDTAGKLFIARGAYNGTKLATGTNVVVSTTGWYQIEVKFILNNSSGSVDVRVNGNTSAEVTYSGDTTSTANEYCTEINFQNQNGANGVGNLFITDLFVNDSTGSQNNTWSGDVKVGCHKPNGVGTYSEFTPSAGSNYQNVDDDWWNMDSDSTYNSSSTSGHRDTYAMENPDVSGTVLAINIIAYLRKDDAGSRNAAIMMRSGSTDDVGSDIALPSGYGAYGRYCIELNPDTSTIWTNTTLNALEPGVKVTS